MIDTSLIKKSLQAAENPHLLETPEKLSEAAAIWRRAQVLGIDTEFLRERTYRAELGLVQVSDGETAWLVDTIKLRHLEPLKALFTDSRILKVFHSASEDLEVLWHVLGVTPAPMIDTQIACAMLGQPLQMSYHHMVKWMMEVEVDKEQTRSNWIRRPLTPAQLHYAATDVVFLPAAAENLKAALESRDRWNWLREDVEAMSDNSKHAVDHEQSYLRINASSHLDLPSLHVLKALAAWREKTADEKNLARGFVIKDPVLVQIATEKPATPSELAEIEGIHPNVRQRHQDVILAIVEASRNLETPLRQNEPLGPTQKIRLKSLRKVVTEKATELDVDPALLASRKLLESLIRTQAAGEPLPDRLTGWRYELITRQFMTILHELVTN